MKVIQQIIRHFIELGALSFNQIEYLKEEGFYQEPTRDDYDSCSEDYNYEDSYDAEPDEQLKWDRIIERQTIKAKKVKGKRFSKRRKRPPNGYPLGERSHSQAAS